MARFQIPGDEASQRQAKYGGTAALYTIVILAVLVMVNWLANRYNKTYDTTSNKQFTLSDQTKKILGDTKGNLTITYIDRTEGFAQAKGILDRYKNVSSKVNINYIDYRKQPTQARAYGVRNAGTAFVEVGPKREEAKNLTEEGITGAVVKLMKNTRKVCFVTGSRERQLDETGQNGLSRYKQLLERDNYETQQVSLLEKPEVPKDCAALVIAGPQLDYTASQAKTLQAYVNNGGHAMFLVDPPLNMGRMRTAPNPELTKVLAEWGVMLDDNLVLEQNTVSQMFGLGPEVPLVADYDSHPIVNDMKGAATGFPLTRSIEIKTGGKASVQKLFSTSNRAVATSNLTASQISMEDPKNRKGPFVLGVAGTISGGKPGSGGRFVVVGTAGFIENSTIGFQANRDFSVNAVNWLTSDEDLISIRPKVAEDRRLNVNASQMNLFLYTVLIAIPLIIIASGISIFLKRR